MRSVYFALKFFYENVLNEKFDEKLPLAKSKQKLPVGCSGIALLCRFAFKRGKKLKMAGY